jgi:hypothetical protein
MYGAIVVGDRCAGSPTAMLRPQRLASLARGPRYLPERYHIYLFHPPGVAHLKRCFWGAIEGTVAIPELFSPENIQRIIRTA